jgi:uncharacterized DUF497 family protein
MNNGDIFEWDESKNKNNMKKHNISFEEAIKAFDDKDRIIACDKKHSETEDRYFCFGKVGDDIITVRYTKRGRRIRIIGAGYWRKGKQIYEKQNEKEK